MENTSQPMDHLKQFSDYYARFAEMLVKAEEINKIFGRTVVIENAINQFDKSGESLNVLLKEYFPSHTLPDNLKKKLGLDDVEKVIKQITKKSDLEKSIKNFNKEYTRKGSGQTLFYTHIQLKKDDNGQKSIKLDYNFKEMQKGFPVKFELPILTNILGSAYCALFVLDLTIEDSTPSDVRNKVLEYLDTLASMLGSEGLKAISVGEPTMPIYDLIAPSGLEQKQAAEFCNKIGIIKPSSLSGGKYEITPLGKNLFSYLGNSGKTFDSYPHIKQYSKQLRAEKTLK